MANISDSDDAKPRAWWSIQGGDSPVIGTAIHDGHTVRSDFLQRMKASEEERLREEDPFTGSMISGLQNHIIVHRSRFEVDLNRPRDQAVYLRPEQCWGIEVWHEEPTAAMVKPALDVHDAYYAMLECHLRDIKRRYGHFVVLDLHSYNHRRGGPTADPADVKEAPDINIGTFSMDRDRWRPVIAAFKAYAQDFDFAGRRLDVGEDVAFQGRGEQTRFVHAHFPQSGCALAVEFKKFFMDEWTGVPDMQAVARLRALLKGVVPVLEAVLQEMK